MSIMPKFDVIIVTTAADYLRVQCNIKRIIELVPAEHFYFVGNDKVGELVTEADYGERVGFVDENSIIPFDEVHKVVKEILGREDVPRGVTGWYYQQFLKMQYSSISRNEYYMSWDGDTVPCKEFSMFDKITGKPFFDMKTEYHEEYFTTLSKLFPELGKLVKKSFISEHMIFNRAIMQELILAIKGNTELCGKTFYEKILKAVRSGELTSNSFSEFETYGTYVTMKHKDTYSFRNWHSIRYGSVYFKPEEMTDEDYRWIGIDFDAVSYEKNQDFEPELSKYFMTKEYRSKLTARYIVETIQENSSEGMKEEWDSPTDKISIIIPVYNEEKYISQCLESIFSQDYPIDLLEVIIVDDLSTDGTRKILSKYEAKYPGQIMYIPLEEHLGKPGKSRNIAMSYASGEYFAFIDSDDLVDKSYISHLHRLITEYDCDIASCSYDMFESDRIIAEDIYPDELYNMQNIVEKKNYLLTDGTRGNVWGRLYRAEFIRKTGAEFAEDLHISEDVFFSQYCMMLAGKCVLSSDTLYFYRVKKNSLFHNARTNHAEDILTCRAGLTALFDENGLLEDIREEYGAIFYQCAINELFQYCEEHSVTEEEMEALKVKLGRVIKEHYPNLQSNRYLSEEQRQVVRDLL